MNERPKAPAEQPAPQTAAGQASPQPAQAEPQQPVGFTPEQHRTARAAGLDLSRFDAGKLAALLRLAASIVEQFLQPPNTSAR
jgi:pyruvate/2-oxoglutarate dehydrogenase complex dihydrolipoamide acyltransferase (E2) component